MIGEMENMIIRQEKLVDKVVIRILEDIENETYRIGEKLPSHEEFQEIMGVSRNTIREALQRLEAMGIVTICQGSGTYVNKVDIISGIDKLTPILKLNETDLTSLIEARKILESNTANLAAINSTEEDIEELKRNLRNMEESLDNLETYANYDMQFHLMLAQFSKNVILYKFVKLISTLLLAQQETVINTPQMASVSFEYHKKIIKSIEERNPSKAESLITEHIDNVYKRLILKTKPNIKKEKISGK
jgi:GntR family transcriptional repressor for pyruvate dehydrogenase complex